MPFINLNFELSYLLLVLAQNSMYPRRCKKLQNFPDGQKYIQYMICIFTKKTLLNILYNMYDIYCII